MTLPKSVYAKPSGYKTYIARGASGYKLWNNFLSGGIAYSPAGRPSAKVITITFSAAPPDLSSITIPGESLPFDSLIYHWNGAPGAGSIPLVAGGGTAAQAATATQVAMAAQISDKWTVTNPSSGVVVMTSLAVIPAGITLVGTTGVAASQVLPVFLSVHPGRFGKNYCTLPA